MLRTRMTTLAGLGGDICFFFLMNGKANRLNLVGSIGVTCRAKTAKILATLD